MLGLIAERVNDLIIKLKQHMDVVMVLTDQRNKSATNNCLIYRQLNNLEPKVQARSNCIVFAWLMRSHGASSLLH